MHIENGAHHRGKVREHRANERIVMSMCERASRALTYKNLPANSLNVCYGAWIGDAHTQCDVFLKFKLKMGRMKVFSRAFAGIFWSFFHKCISHTACMRHNIWVSLLWVADVAAVLPFFFAIPYHCKRIIQILNTILVL